MTSLLHVEDLRVSFHTKRGVVRAVDGVSFTLDKGQTLGIVGESGSGKTVLLRTVMGLIGPSDAEISGSVRFKGQEITSMNSKERRRLWGTDMAMVFQDPLTALNPLVRVGRQITEGLVKRTKAKRSEARRQALSLLESVHIPDPSSHMRKYPHELSGGMRQRVVLASALSLGPSLIFADEPVTALDVTIKAQIMKVMEKERARREMAMILVSHDLGVVTRHAHVVAVMYAGRIVEMARSYVLYVHTRMPYTQALIDSLPDVRGDRAARMRSIEGQPPSPIDLPPGCPFNPRCPYAQQRCRQETPPIRTAGEGHTFGCWFPLGDT